MKFLELGEVNERLKTGELGRLRGRRIDRVRRIGLGEVELPLRLLFESVMFLLVLSICCGESFAKKNKKKISRLDKIKSRKKKNGRLTGSKLEF